ncbi:unnamed protein product [Effrenium voratum]|nr:unnamed protein product [Effrenium voratum]
MSEKWSSRRDSAYAWNSWNKYNSAGQWTAAPQNDKTGEGDSGQSSQNPNPRDSQLNPTAVKQELPEPSAMSRAERATWTTTAEGTAEWYDPSLMAMWWPFAGEGSDWSTEDWVAYQAWCMEQMEQMEQAGMDKDAESEEKSSGYAWKPLSGKRHELVPKRANLKEQFEKGEAKQVTTLMLRNVPNAYDRETLMSELDSLDFAGAYDFLYLPIDSATKNNVGYAFVNFKDEKSCEECMSALSGYFFRGQPYNRRRPAIVSVAHLQGLEANLEHYSRTQVFFAPLPCQRPWVAPDAQESMANSSWAPGGFAKMMEDAAVRPGTTQDGQCFNHSVHRRRLRDRWWQSFAAYDMYSDMYSYYEADHNAPPGFMEIPQFNQGLGNLTDLGWPDMSPDLEEGEAGPVDEVLIQMLRGQGNMANQKGAAATQPLRPRPDVAEGAASPAVVMRSVNREEEFAIEMLNVPENMAEPDLRQILEHVGVDAFEVKFEEGPKATQKVTVHFVDRYR